jgi:xanthine dehydrogenase molybdopterin-binding subunit B
LKYDFLGEDEIVCSYLFSNFVMQKQNTFFSQLFADKEITFAGQVYGMIVATSQKMAEYAASKVKIVYSNGPRQKPMITIRDVLASNDKTRVSKEADVPATQPAGIIMKNEMFLCE